MIVVSMIMITIIILIILIQFFDAVVWSIDICRNPYVCVSVFM